MNGKPIRSLGTCSIAAKLLLHRAVVPTTSPGRAPIPAVPPIRRRFPMPCRLKVRLPLAEQKMGRTTLIKPRQQNRVKYKSSDTVFSYPPRHDR